MSSDLQTDYANTPDNILKMKASYFVDLVISVSKKFIDELLATTPSFENLDKTSDEIYKIVEPIISSFILFKVGDYVSRRFIKESDVSVAFLNHMIAHFRTETGFDPIPLINQYRDSAENNSYMRQMFIGDKVCKACGGTFSNRGFIDEISIKFMSFFDTFIIPTIGRVWVISGGL
jgi:hypothetical protein